MGNSQTASIWSTHMVSFCGEKMEPEVSHGSKSTVTKMIREVPPFKSTATTRLVTLDAAAGLFPDIRCSTDTVHVLVFLVITNPAT